jgi:hypothetical protein
MLRRIKAGRALGPMAADSIYNAAAGVLPGWRPLMAALERVA